LNQLNCRFCKIGVDEIVRRFRQINKTDPLHLYFDPIINNQIIDFIVRRIEAVDQLKAITGWSERQILRFEKKDQEPFESGGDSELTETAIWPFRSQKSKQINHLNKLYVSVKLIEDQQLY